MRAARVQLGWGLSVHVRVNLKDAASVSAGTTGSAPREPHNQMSRNDDINARCYVVFCPNLHSTCHQIIRARVPHRPQRLGRVHQTASRKRDGDTRRHVQRAIKSAFRSDLATKERMPLARLAMMIRWAVSKPHVIPGAYHASQQTERKPGRTSEGSMSMVGGGSFRDSVANGASDQ